MDSRGTNLVGPYLSGVFLPSRSRSVLLSDQILVLVDWILKPSVPVLLIGLIIRVEVAKGGSCLIVSIPVYSPNLRG